jgi:hypothetical protein
MPQDISDPLDERIIEQELNLQNRLNPRPNPEESPETGNPGRTNRRHSANPQRKPARLNYHRVHCTVCNHPERDAIEEAFLQWRRPCDLAHEFKLSHRTAIYRHAHALGLFEKRAAHTRHALNFILEQSSIVEPSADAIIRAVRAYSCLDENGRWHEPNRRLIVTHENVERPPATPKPEPELFATHDEQKMAQTDATQ